MTGFFKGLLRLSGRVVAEVGKIVIGGVLVLLGFVAVIYGQSIDGMIVAGMITGIGIIMMFVGFFLCMKHFV
ncbi:hypothetical protein [Yoonia sp. SS1-5]|uniref:Uncharacterized protein n=1 Tax=Yoonia rhodophyticola TaxID=3137370 RepID=A0AAN0MAC8_9RHOB